MYLGEDRNAKGRGPKPRIVFSRAIKQGNAERSIVDEAGAELALVKAMDQLDRSMLDPRVTATTSSRIFVNQVTKARRGLRPLVNQSGPWGLRRCCDSRCSRSPAQSRCALRAFHARTLF